MKLKGPRRFLLSVQPRDVPDDDAAEGGTSHVNGRPDAAPGNEGRDEQGKRLSGAQRKKLAKEERKNKRGANKGRRFQKVRDELELCFRIASGKQCEFGSECVVHSLFPPPSRERPNANVNSGAASRMTFPRTSLRSQETSTAHPMKTSPLNLHSFVCRTSRCPRRDRGAR